MAHEIGIYKTTDVDESILIEDIRREDHLEMVQWTAQGPEFAVRESVRQSEVCYSVYAEDSQLLCICGAKTDNVIEASAVLWSLSTNAVNSNRIAFVKGTRKVLDRIMREMPNTAYFHNWVSNDYPAAQRWLEWMGAGWSVKGIRRGYGNSVFREFFIENPYYKEGN